MSATPQAPDEGSRGRLRRAAHLALALLDGVIAAYALMLLAYLAFGGIDLGFLSVHRFSKPFLLLFILVSLRVALPAGSWLRRLSRLPWARPRGPWAEAVADAGAVLIPTVIASKAVAFAANLLLPPANVRGFTMPFDSLKFAETFAAWDSGWYWNIARFGYYYDPAGQSSIAFFPLYPILVRLLAWPFGIADRSVWIAGIVLSLACFAGALVVLHRFAADTLGGREPARRTVLYVAVFPFAFFLTQVYTESLFLLLSVSAVALAARGRWWWAGLLGGLTALTRPNGILIALPLGLLALMTAESGLAVVPPSATPGTAARPSLRAIALRALALLQVPLAFGLFCGYVQRLSGDPLGWLHAQRHWGYSVGNPPWVELMRVVDAFETLGCYRYFFGDPLAFYYLLHAVFALGLVALVPQVFSRLGLPLGSYAALSLLVPLTGNALEGIGRYAATLFPFFMVLGTNRSRRIHEALIIVGASGLALLSALFVTLHKVY